MKNIENWLLAHPAMIHVMEGLLYAVLIADYAYLKPLLVPGGTVPELTVILAGLGSAAFIAAKFYIQTTISQNQGQIIAWAEDFLQQLNKTSSAPVPPPINALSVSKPISAAMSPLVKMIAFLFGLSLMASSAMAWEVPGKAFGLEKTSVLKEMMSVPSTSENDLVLVPAASLGFSLSGSMPSYGYSGGYNLVYANISPNATAGMVNLIPYIGIGGVLYIDMGPWINSGFQQQVKADGGIDLIGPQIEGLVPTAEIVWNFQSGEQKEIIGFAAPFELLSGTIVKIVQID